RRLAVVDVPDGAHVHVRLGPDEFLFAHLGLSLRTCARLYQCSIWNQAPRRGETWWSELTADASGPFDLGDDLVFDVARDLLVLRELHRVRGASLSLTAQVGGVAEHLGQ